MTKSYSPVRQAITQTALDEKTGLLQYRASKKQVIPWTSLICHNKLIKLTNWRGRWVAKAVDLVVALGLDTQVSGKICRQLDPKMIAKTSPGRVGHWLVYADGLHKILQLATTYGANFEAARQLEKAVRNAIVDLATPSVKEKEMPSDGARGYQQEPKQAAKPETQAAEPAKAPTPPAPAPVEPITCAHLAVMFKAISEVEGKVPDRATKALLDAVVKVSNGAVK